MLFSQLTSIQWYTAIFTALLLGFTKTGISGLNMLTIPLMAEQFGGKASSGIMLILLIFADSIAIGRYYKYIKISYVWKLIPWVLGGLLTGMLIGNTINDTQFKTIIAISIFLCLTLMIWRERSATTASIPTQWWFSALMGFGGGFTTMIGNAAGPIITIYLLSMGLPKYNFLATSACFFAIINLIKLPLHIFVWKSITSFTASFSMTLFGLVILGAIMGICTVKHVPEKNFRWIIISLTALSAIKLIF